MSAREALCISGAGNRFYLVDARAEGLPEDAARRARLACTAQPEAPGAFAPDGLLFVLERAGRLAMVLFNADGSRPEACGNALRCLVHWAVEARLLAGNTAVVDTDGGEREVRWRREGQELFVEVCLGAPRRAGRVDVASDSGRGPMSFERVDLANPHAVLCLEDVASLSISPAELEALARRVDVPGGVNVELAAREARRRGPGSRIFMRVFERGVGETQACGTGSAAAAWIAAARFDLAWPVAVRQPGGILTVDRDAEGRLWLSGPVHTHGSASFSGAAWATCSTS